jgi:hypothetical protein
MHIPKQPYYQEGGGLTIFRHTFFKAVAQMPSVIAAVLSDM